MISGCWASHEVVWAEAAIWIVAELGSAGSDIILVGDSVLAILCGDNAKGSTADLCSELVPSETQKKWMAGTCSNEGSYLIRL